MSSNACGTLTGIGGACGKHEKNTSDLSRDRASAAVLCTPAMCRARMAIRKCAVKKCKHRNRCMRRGSRAKPDERAQTTAMLSENAWTVDDLQPGPQTATARTTGTISLAAM